MSESLRTYRVGIAWLVAEKGLLLVSGVFVGFWVVRTLGPVDYGRLSVALAVTAILAGLATMGLDNVVLRRLAMARDAQARILRDAILIRLCGSVAHVAICWLSARLLFADDRDVIVATLLIACAALFRVPDVIGLWLQVENRYSAASIVRLSSRLLADAIRLLLILSDASLYGFAAAYVVESLFSMTGFLIAGRRMLSRPVAQFDRVLLRDGAPITASALLSALYARVDQLALYALAGAAVNGQYAAAVRVSEVFNVVITSISAVAATHFGKLHQADDAVFDAELSRYHRLFVIAGLTVSALLCFFAAPITSLLYGEQFQEAVLLLRIHAWTVALVCASVAIEPWFHHYRKLDYYVLKTLIALVFAVPTVWFATARFGAPGTAAAVVATYAVSVFVTNAALPQLRAAFRLQTRALPALGARP